MRSYLIPIIVVSCISTAAVAAPLGNMEQGKTQSVIVPDRGISFERGKFSVVSYGKSSSDILSNSEVIEILKMAGFSGEGLKMAWAIATKESTLRPNAHNDNHRTGDNSYGLFQINMRGSMGPDRRERYGLRSNKDLFNPLINARVAYEMSNGGKNWGAWSTNRQAQKILKHYPLNID